MWLLWVACLLPPEAIDARFDADGDGYDDAAFGGTDCNDDDPEFHPGAEELCDELDRNCDGRSGLFDGDGDFFPGCEECDDNNADIHPDATEVCDDQGVDEDCDGLVNDEDDSVDLSTGTPHWPDADGDGLGDVQAVAVYACGDAGGLAPDNSDCNDADPWVPMRREWCRNGIDDDCVGALADDQCRFGVDAVTAAAHFAGDAGDGFGYSVAFVPDVDGDGASDIAIGVPLLGTDDVGAVWVYSGTSLGEVDVRSPIATIEGARPGDLLGNFMLSADWNHDGTDGLVVAAPGASMGTGPGAVYLLDAPTAGVQKLSYSGPSVVGLALDGKIWMAGFSSVKVTNDTLMVGFSLPLNPESRLAGYTHEIQGPETLTDADWTRVLQSPYMAFDEAASLSDLDGDGVSDLVVGTNNGNRVGIAYGPLSGGGAMVFDVEHTNSLTEFGEALTTLDLNGDGNTELVLTGREYGPGQNNHVLSVVSGFSSGSLEHTWRFTGGTANGGEMFRQSLDAGGDLDDDGDPDLIWGQPEAQRAWLIYSNFPLDAGTYGLADLRNFTTHLAQSIGATDDSGFGRHVRIGPDANGDGRADLLITSRLITPNSSDVVGEVSFLWGGRW